MIPPPDWARQVFGDHQCSGTEVGYQVLLLAFHSFLVLQSGTAVWGGAGVLARVLLYLIGNGGIYVQVLSGRSADELGMVFILCYQPLYHRLIQCYTMEIRMGREWVR